MDSDLITTADTARALDVTPARIRQLISEGKITAEMIGRDWLISSDEIERYRRQPRSVGRPLSAGRANEFLADVDAGRRHFDELAASIPKLRRRTATGTLAGRWIELFEAGDPQADEIRFWLLRRFAGPIAIASLAPAVGNDDNLSWTLIRTWVDHIAEHPDALPESIAERPPSNGSQRVDNLLAGIAEREADLAGIPRPPWASLIPPLDEPWAPKGTPKMIETERRTAPPQFLARKIWFGAANAWRNR